MVGITIADDRLHFDVEGWDRLWSLKSHLDIPLDHVVDVRADPEPARGWWHGLRLPGTDIPGILTAGTFYHLNGAVFYDVHDPENTIVIQLDHEHYKQLVVEVENPGETAARIQSAIAARRS